MHNRLFANQQQLQPEALGPCPGPWARRVGFPDLSRQREIHHENQCQSQAGSAGRRDGHPGVFLGYTQAGGAEVKATKFLSGRSRRSKHRSTSFSTRKSEGSMPASRRPARHLPCSTSTRGRRRTVVFGTKAVVDQVLAACGWQINTAFVEWLNLSLRQRVAAMGRRSATPCR